MNIPDFLRQHDVTFDVLRHRPTYDAQRMAQAVHTPGKEVAKTVLLRADHGYQYIVAVLPATKNLNLQKVGELLGGANVELATEQEIEERCPDCETGALPPFGSQYGMKTLLDEPLLADEEIVFEGNTHEESIRMKLDDFRQIEEPVVGVIS